MSTQTKYITSTKSSRKNKQTELISVVLVYHSFILRMKSFGNAAMIPLSKQEKVIDRHIAMINRKIPNNEIIISVGYEANRIQLYVNKKYPKSNIRIVENTRYEDSNICESIRIAINNTKNDHILIVNGGILFEDRLIEQIILNNVHTAISMPDSNSTLDVGVNIDKINNNIEHISYGAVSSKWCEILYLNKSSVVNEVRKCLSSAGFKNKVFYELINIIIKKNIKLNYVYSDSRVIKIKNTNI